MSDVVSLLLLVLTCAVIGYLVCTLVFPDRF